MKLLLEALIVMALTLLIGLVVPALIFWAFGIS